MARVAVNPSHTACSCCLSCCWSCFWWPPVDQHYYDYHGKFYGDGCIITFKCDHKHFIKQQKCKIRLVQSSELDLEYISQLFQWCTLQFGPVAIWSSLFYQSVMMMRLHWLWHKNKGMLRESDKHVDMTSDMVLLLICPIAPPAKWK